MQAIEMLPEDRRAGPIFEIVRSFAESDPTKALRHLENHLDLLIDPEDPGQLAYKRSNYRLIDQLKSAIEENEIDLADFPDLPMVLQWELGINVPLSEQASWVATRPDGDSSTGIAEEITARMFEVDPRATSEWLGTLQPGEVRDQSIATFTRAVSEADPEAATLWAAQIGDPQLRERFLRVALRRWKAADPEQALASIGEFGLSEVAIESLLHD